MKVRLSERLNLFFFCFFVTIFFNLVFACCFVFCFSLIEAWIIFFNQWNWQRLDCFIPRGVELREERMAFFELRKHCSLVLPLTEIVQHLWGYITKMCVHRTSDGSFALTKGLGIVCIPVVFRSFKLFSFELRNLTDLLLSLYMELSLYYHFPMFSVWRSACHSVRPKASPDGLNDIEENLRKQRLQAQKFTYEPHRRPTRFSYHPHI